ncbi:hypothetical protein J4219_07510 [Candidatus Woesearchaeota archaeon]|nr:hypothetical protein [Candidatus Woesearchaeota archaeon]
MSDSRLRELERRWKETRTLEDELVYLSEAVRMGRNPIELYQESLRATPDWTQYGDNDHRRLSTARAGGDRIRTIFASNPAIARAVIQRGHDNDVAEIPESEIEITALCAQYVRQLSCAGGIHDKLTRRGAQPPVLTAHFRSEVMLPSQEYLINVLNVMGLENPTHGAGFHFDYLALFGSKYSVRAEQPMIPRGRFPRSYTFYTHKLDKERIIIGRIEHAMLRIETTEWVH